MIIEGYDLLDKYRRLRILYNRLGIFGKPIFYKDWFKYTFQTKLGSRTFVCTIVNRDTKDEMLEFFYEDSDGVKLFKIEINKNFYNYESMFMTEYQIWLAIHELEELSYKELKLHETGK